MPLSTPIIVAAVVTLVVIAIIAFAISRYRIPATDEVFVIVGRRDGEGSGQKVVKTGTVVIPIVEKLYSISLASRQMTIRTSGHDSNTVPLSVEATAIVKVGSTPGEVKLAAERFLHSQHEIESFVDKTVSGVLRTVMGQMTISELILDRTTLKQNVTEAAAESLSKMGLQLDDLQILQITDDNGYIEALGAPQDAAAKMEASKARAVNTQRSAEAQLEADQAVAEREAQLKIRKAQLDSDAQKAQAEASAAGPTQQAIADKAIAEQETLTAVERAKLREAELKAEQIAQAAANAEQVRIDAEAAKDRAIAEAEAKARAIEIEAIAEADRITRIGDAEAAAIKAKAEALNSYGAAALRQMELEAAPKIVHELAAPMAQIKDLTVVSTDGANAVTGQVAALATQIEPLLASLGLGAHRAQEPVAK